MAGCRVQGVPELVSACCWVGLGSRASSGGAGLLVWAGSDMAGYGTAVVPGLVLACWWVGQTSEVPRASASPLVGSWGLWLQGPGGPGVGVSLLVSGAGAQGVLGLVLAHWYMDFGPATAGCRTSVVPGLVSAH